MKQMRNYGYTRNGCKPALGLRLQNGAIPQLDTLPYIAIIGIVLNLLGASLGGASAENLVHLCRRMDNLRIMFHIPVDSWSFTWQFAGFVLRLEQVRTEILELYSLAPLFVFLAHFLYDQGVQKALKEIRRTVEPEVGRQIDDRDRTI